MAGFEWLRERRFEPHTYRVDYVTLQLGIEVLIGLIVGWLMLRLLGQTRVAETRAAEAERLRDQLGRRADVLEAANRCARALELVARARPGLRRLHPRGARAAALRPDRDRAERERRRAGDGRRRRRRGRGAAARLGPAGPRDAARGSAADEPDRLPARHEQRRLPRGGRVPRARPALPARDAAAPGRPGDRDALARAPGAGRVQRGGDRARGPARPPRGERGPEHPRLREPSARPSRSCAASRRCGPTSSRSSRTSCARRWPP